jgi:hypothetical protein
MDQDLIWLLTAGVAGIVSSVASGALRSLLRSIFRRPRKTSVIVKIDGQRLEFSGATPSEAREAVDRWLASVKGTEQPKSSAVAHDAQSAAGGDVDE